MENVDIVVSIKDLQWISPVGKDLNHAFGGSDVDDGLGVKPVQSLDIALKMY